MPTGNPTAEELEQLSYQELKLLPQGIPGIEATPEYQRALALMPAQAGLEETDPSAQAQLVISAMQKLGRPAPPALAAGEAKKAQTEARSKVIIEATKTPGARVPLEIAQDKGAVALAKKNAPAAGVTEEGIINMTGVNALPEWVPVNAATTKKDKQKVVDVWNRLAPAAQRVSTWDEFLLKNTEPSETAKAAFTFAGLADPVGSHTFSLPDGGKFTVEQSELNHFFQSTSAFGPEKLSQVQDAINMASLENVRVSGTNELAWEPFMAYERAGRRSMSPRETKEYVPDKGHGRHDITKQKFDTQEGYRNIVDEAGRHFLAKEHGKAYAETGNHTLAYLKVMNPELYTHVVKDGKVAPESLEYAIAAAQVLGEGGWDQMADIGLFGQESTIQDLTTYVDRSKSGGVGASITLPDPLKVEQSMKDLYNAWFGLDPSSAEYGTFKDDLYAKLRGTLPGVGQRVNQDVDVGAQLRNFAETSANYQALFSAKPAGLSADEYVNTNRQAVGSILGSDLDPAAVRAGQLTGDTQTAIGAAAGSTKAKTNSTFQERLARAAQLVSAST